MFRRIIILLIITSGFFYSFKKKEACKDCHTGTLEEVGRTFCGRYWQITLDQPDKDGGNQIRALNIQDFQVSLKNGQKVELTFADESVAHPCQDAKYVNLKTIRDI